MRNNKNLGHIGNDQNKWYDAGEKHGSNRILDQATNIIKEVVKK